MGSNYLSSTALQNKTIIVQFPKIDIGFWDSKIMLKMVTVSLQVNEDAGFLNPENARDTASVGYHLKNYKKLLSLNNGKAPTTE